MNPLKRRDEKMENPYYNETVEKDSKQRGE